MPGIIVQHDLRSSPDSNYVNLFLIPVTEKVKFNHVSNWKTHWSYQVWIFHRERYKAAVLRQNSTHHPDNNSDTMPQITGTSVTLLMLLTVSLFCQDTAAWGKIFSLSVTFTLTLHL